MPELIPVLTKKAIAEKVAALAKEISTDYQGCDLIVVGVLKGAFLFLADFVRCLTIPVKIDFIQASSYGLQNRSSETIRLSKGLETDIKNQHVLLLEDIVDTGLTMRYITDYLISHSPKSIKICALIDKRERRQTTMSIDYKGHVVNNGFLVGYGLDYAEHYRNLPEIYLLKLLPGETE